MKISQVAAQLWTVRHTCKTGVDLAHTARRLRNIGYEAVQLSGLGPIPTAEVAQIMRDHGLVICATHEPPADILERPEQCIERMQTYGCTLTAYPAPAGVNLGDAAVVGHWIRSLDASGARFHAAGMQLGYHNHGFEFVMLDGRPILEHIYRRTDPRHVVGEIDTYWIQYGGGDPVDWCRRLRGRLPFIHLKDYGFTLENRPDYREIGRGTLDFRRIIPAAEAAGCRWFIVEQDSCPGDPFESLRLSYEFLRGHLQDLPSPDGTWAS